MLKFQLFTETPVQTDIEKMEAAINSLKEASEDLFKDQITAIEVQIAEAKAKAQSEIDKAVDTVQEAERTFIEKYGNKIVQGVQILLLGYIVYRIL